MKLSPLLQEQSKILNIDVNFTCEPLTGISNGTLNAAADEQKFILKKKLLHQANVHTARHRYSIDIHTYIYFI